MTEEQHAAAALAAALERITVLERAVAELQRQSSGEREFIGAAPKKSTHDAAVIRALAATVGSVPFTSAEVIVHARVVPALRQALAAARATTARRLGKRLERLADQAVAGVAVTRIGEESSGRIWQLVDVTSTTSTNPLVPAPPAGGE
jgi:hypothetical protein